VNTRLDLMSLAALLTACDPGGTYHVPGAREVRDDGAHFVMAGPSQTSLRAHATWFTGNVSTLLSIKNDGTTPLVIRPDRIRMFDCDGTELRLCSSSKQPRCSDRTDQSKVTLAGSESCQMDVGFEVVPDEDRLKTLTLIHGGVSRGSVDVPISITFVLNRRDSDLLRALDLNRRCVTPR
jgi:hypothetical protein